MTHHRPPRSRRQRGTGPWRRHRATLVIVGAAVAAVVVALLVGGRPATSEALDPDNPGADGARAVARVLDDQGVDVQVVRGAEALDRAELGPSTTVLVTSTYLLGRSTSARLLDALAGADLVLAEPEPGAIDALDLQAAGLDRGARRRPRPPGVPTRC